MIYRDIIQHAKCIQIDEKRISSLNSDKLGPKKIIGRSMESGWKKENR